MKDPQSPDLYELIGAKALEIEEELKWLNRWQTEPLSPDKFDNMGAFGSNTMAFEQWLQFILLPRIQQIIHDKSEFPSGSMLGTYAIRVFDGDYEATRLRELLCDIDQLINTPEEYKQDQAERAQGSQERPVGGESISLGDKTIPRVIHTLAGLLPQFEGDDLENQLQTFDNFLSILDPSVRPDVAKLLDDAAGKASKIASRQRIKDAAISVLNGGRAAEPYNHDEAMRKYREDHKNNFSG